MKFTRRNQIFIKNLRRVIKLAYSGKGKKNQVRDKTVPFFVCLGDIYFRLVSYTVG